MKRLMEIAKEQVEILSKNQEKTNKPEDLIKISSEIRLWVEIMQQLNLIDRV